MIPLRIFWGYAELIVLIVLLTLGVALLSSRHFRAALRILGTLVGGLAAALFVFWALGKPSAERVLVSHTSGAGNEDLQPRFPSGSAAEPAASNLTHTADTQQPGGSSRVYPETYLPPPEAEGAGRDGEPTEHQHPEPAVDAGPAAELAQPGASAASEPGSGALEAPLGDGPVERGAQGEAVADEGPQPLLERPIEEAVSASLNDDGRSSGARASPEPPAWVTAPTGKQPDGSYHIIVKSGPFKTRIECDQELRSLVALGVDHYVELLLGRETVRRAMGDGFRGSTLLSASELDNLVRQSWEEHGEAAYPVGEVVTVHALVAFAPQVQRRIEMRFHEQVSRARSWQAIIGSGSLLGLLATVYGYLRLDMLTRGYYTRRLRLAAAAMILAIVGGTAAYFLA